MMRIFRKKEEKQCCCKGVCDDQSMQTAEGKKQETGIKILGSGCAKCQALEEVVRNALAQLQLDIPVEHVSDYAQIASYGVMTTPALVIDGNVVSYGKVLSIIEVKEILQRGK